jgi:hypothetical protein
MEQLRESPANLQYQRPELTGKDYHACLARLHEVLRPRTYFEIGTAQGSSLMLAQCASIAVDPTFLIQVRADSRPALCLFQMRSDDFFRFHDPRSILGADIDLAFLDGMHLVEYLLRDFMNTEKACHRQSLIALHDCLPLDYAMTARDGSHPASLVESVRPDWWTGDVWKILLILRKYRPDLTVELFNAPPTGLVLIRGLNPESDILSAHYQEIVDRYQNPPDEFELFLEFQSDVEVRDTEQLSERIIEPLSRAKSASASLVHLHSGAVAISSRVSSDSGDLALGKPALSSSVSRWSRYQDPLLDACGANVEAVQSDYGFHTAEENEPWWMVDLLGEYEIEEVTIVNRAIHQQRFRTFRIDSSRDGDTWATLFAQTDPIDVSYDPEWPLRVWFANPIPARYVRIVLLGVGPFHLRRVQVFGTNSVVGGKSLIGRLLVKHSLRDFFEEGSELRGGLLSQMPNLDAIEPLRLALAKERDHTGIALLRDLAADRGWPMRAQPDDLAVCKPAVSSSVSRWAKYPDPERDACGANSEDLADDYGFHTEHENKPWWKVDLLGDYLVEKIAIVNRTYQKERFRSFRLQSSMDGGAWTTRYTQADTGDISSDPDCPWEVQFAEPFPARYVRIVLTGMGILHLRRVQIYGTGRKKQRSRKKPADLGADRHE